MSSNEQIIEMLKSRVPYTEIQAKFKVSSKTIAAIAKNAGIVQRKRGPSQASDIVDTKTCDTDNQGEITTLKEMNAALKDGVSELYQAFLKIADNPGDAHAILEKIKIDKIDGAVKYL